MSITAYFAPAFCWRARDQRRNARTGQVGACVRAGTATLTDVNGATVTLVNNQPRFQTVSGVILFKGGAQTTDYLKWLLPVLPEACTIYLKLINRGAPAGTMAVAGLGTADGSLMLSKTTSNTYQARHHNGTAAVTSTSAAATTGQTLEFRIVLRATGVIQIYTTTNGGSETAATASASNALGAAWGGTVAMLLAGGVSGDSGDDDVAAIAYFPGEPSLTLCRSVL